MKKVWISFEDDGHKTEGFFELIEQTANYVKIKSGNNILIIPFHKVNKIKLKGGNNKV